MCARSFEYMAGFSGAVFHTKLVLKVPLFGRPVFTIILREDAVNHYPIWGYFECIATIYLLKMLLKSHRMIKRSPARRHY